MKPTPESLRGEALMRLERTRAAWLVRCANSLRLLDPQQVLERGFSLLQDETGRLLSRQADFHAGQHIVATVRDGQVPLTPLAPLSPASPPQQSELDL